jgi:hypothetical protein
MSRFPVNPTPARRFGAAAFLLSLCLAGCEQQQALPVAAAPLNAASAQPNRYYVNAQVSSKEVIEQLDPKTITSMNVLQGQQAADYAHDAGVKGVILVQTR